MQFVSMHVNNNFALAASTCQIDDIVGAFVPIDPVNVRTKFEVHSFTRS